MDWKKHIVVALLAMATSQTMVAQEQRSADPRTASVEEALSAFVTAFDNLDWQAFRKCFSTTATIFHPAAPNTKLIDSPEQFEKAWLGVFEKIKKSSGSTSPPYMNLHPLDLRVEKLSEEVVLITFHLVDRGTVSRRTLVFKREPDGWKIVHIHASNITAP
jgi:ketosteroid isomerase-like protein